MKKLFILILVTIIAIIGCTGPEGPAGPSGNANVKTFRFKTELKNWTLNSANGYAMLEKEIPLITENIKDYGAVLVYVKSSSNFYWTLWDQTYIVSGSGFNYFHAIDDRKLILFVESVTRNGVPALLSNVLEFKVVIIQGTNITSSINLKEIENKNN